MLLASLRAGSVAVGGDCAAFEPLTAPADLDRTPRANAEAELLALEASGAFVAP
jgi:hypothetical protein